MEEKLKILNIAFETYNLDDRENLEEELLNYISVRLLLNKETIKSLIETLEEEVTFHDIWDAFEKARAEESHYKESQEFHEMVSNFYAGTYLVPKGNILAETDDILEIVKFFVMAIKTRNTITISKLEYREVGIDMAVLLIFREALRKFGLDSNLIRILPYDECEYDDYDEVMTDRVMKERQKSNEYLIYIESEEFRQQAEEDSRRLEEKGLKCQVSSGEFYHAINHINTLKPIGSCIYTKNPQTGYRFINLVHSNNVFVNTTLLNARDIEEGNTEYYVKKHIIYPMKNEV
ncbi:MAG: hypothetical protein IJ629_07055 [Clostridia bacterium]|nr:hypothetical protein [Clostridia bacterium]